MATQSMQRFSILNLNPCVVSAGFCSSGDVLSPVFRSHPGDRPDLQTAHWRDLGVGGLDLLRLRPRQTVCVGNLKKVGVNNG